MFDLTGRKALITGATGGKIQGLGEGDPYNTETYG